MTLPPSTTTQAARYPKRPAFFANKFIRLIGKVCLANEVGADVCWLLTNVVSVEDAKSYRGAVTFFNEQLMPLIGVKNVPALIRVRSRAVDSGWLHYTPGGKGVAGRYWVTVPAEFQGMDDTPGDENPAEYRDVTVTKTLQKADRKRSGSVTGSG